MNTSSDSYSSPNRSAHAGWRVARRLLVAVGAVVTLIAVFYTVENWRGQQAWENRRRQLESKGEVLDWSACIPAPVPDDQNFFKAPKMQEWFVKDSSSTKNSGAVEPANEPDPFVAAPPPDTRLVVAEVRIALPNEPTNSQPADAVLRFEDPAEPERVGKLLGQAIGRCAIGAKQCVLIAQPMKQFKPLHLVLQAERMPSANELDAFFPHNPLTNLALAYSEVRYLQIERAGSNAFRVSLKEPVYGAADYLSWTEPLTPTFDLVRKALERPYARIDCDYQQPFAIGIPNFVRIRGAVQILSQRAQSYLLLGQSEAAWREVALVRDLCQSLMAKPSGKPMTLVAAMINVAVTGLYANVVEDGLRLHAWREPQLLALEGQLKDTDLLGPVLEAFRAERAATCRTFETIKRGDLVKLFNVADPVSKFALTWMPRGWFYQNMAVGAELSQEVIGSLDPTNQLVRPGQVSQIVRRLAPRSQQRSPYTFLVAMSFPNFAKAVQTAARTQTLVNQARAACALERARLAQGQYPEKLDALTPRFVEKIPHDLIGGRPLRYRRTEGGGYQLYSIGWDEKDEGGVVGKSNEEGDWVWELR